MNPDAQLDALLRAARKAAPDTSRAEHAFETRLAARLREERSGSWFAWAWRLSPYFAALAIASAVWCRMSIGLEADADTLLDTVRSSSQPSLLAWWPEDDR